MEKRSYEIICTTDTDSNHKWNKDYYVKIVNRKITKIGATIKKTKNNYWFFSSEDPLNITVCKDIMGKYTDEQMYKTKVQEIMAFINKKYPKFYKIVQKKTER